MFLFIIISAGSVSRGDTIWISSLKKGGVAYRCGMLQSGDAILSINGQSLEQCNLRDAADILKQSGDNVVLKISKDSGWRELAEVMLLIWYICTSVVCCLWV